MVVEIIDCDLDPSKVQRQRRNMMDIEKELTEAKRKQQELVNGINQLTEKRRVLLQEALKVEGEIRALKRLTKEGIKINEN